MSGESKRRNKKQLRLEELPPEIRGAVEKAIQETINNILAMIAATGKTKVRIKEREKPREELERVLADLINIDPQELSEYLGEEEFLAGLISTLYHIKKVATSRPTNPDSKLILMYFRAIDAIAAMLVEMIKNARGMVLERTIQIKQAMVLKEDPREELEKLEAILVLLDGLRKHIWAILDEMDM